MRTKLFCNIVSLMSLALLLLTACRSSAPPVKFYTLNPISNTATGQPLEAREALSIGVGPVSIPEILDRPQIVIRSGPNTLQIDEFHRWAGRLDEDFARVLAQNISRLLGTEQVAVYPWEVEFKPDYRIALEIRHFEGQWGEDVVLDVAWRISGSKHQKLNTVKTSVITEALPAADYELLVAAKSRAIAELSREIVREIRHLQGTKD